MGDTYRKIQKALARSRHDREGYKSYEECSRCGRTKHLVNGLCSDCRDDLYK